MGNRARLATIRSSVDAALFGSILCFLLGCSGSRGLENRMVTRIENNCASSPKCTLRMKDVTEFAWDRMYAFKYTASEKEVEDALGVKPGVFRELQRKLVFTKNGRIVFQEDEPTNVEHPIKDEVVFDIPDNASYRVYGPEVAFNVSKMTSEAGPYYELTQIK